MNLKKISNLFVLFFCLLTCATSPLAAAGNSPRVSEDNIDEGPEISTPTYAVDPIPPKPVQPQQTQMKKNKTTAAIILTTAAAIAIGLIASGADTGKRAHPSSSK